MVLRGHKWIGTASGPDSKAPSLRNQPLETQCYIHRPKNTTHATHPVAMAALLADSTPTALVADFLQGRGSGSECLDTALRPDITRPDVLRTAATSLFHSMAL